MMKNTKHMTARTAGGRRLSELQRTPTVELHRERMAINARAQRIAWTHQRGDREICKNSLCKLRQRVTEYNRRATQMRDTVNEDDKRAGSAPSANADTLHHEADNKETTIPTKDWQADLAKSIISMFNQY